MPHGRKLVKLGRTWQSRLHVLRNLATSLIEHQRIRVTPARARAVRGFADRIITLVKKPHLTDIRKRQLLGGILYSQSAVDKVMTDLLPRYKDKWGNYTRVKRDGWRRGDGSDMSIIEYRGNPYELYEQETFRETAISKLPEFEFKLLGQELALYESRLDMVKQTLLQFQQSDHKSPSDELKMKRSQDQVKFFERQIDRVKRELTYFKVEQKPAPAKAALI